MLKKIFISISLIILCVLTFFLYNKQKDVFLISIKDDSKYLIDKNKLTFLFFFNPNCSACVYNLRNLTALKSILESYDIDFFCIINNDEYNYAGAARSIFVRFDLDYDILYDEILYKKYNISLFPSFIIIYQDKIIFQKIGFTDWNDSKNTDELVELLKKYV